MNILVAEDNLANQKVVLMMLKSLNLTADVVEDGKAVLDACSKKQYDLILMDINMPKLDGLETTAALNQRYGDNPARPQIFALTANVLASTQEHCVELKMDGFIQKPLRIGRLKQVISTVSTERGQPGSETSSPETPQITDDVDFSMFDSIMQGDMGKMCRPHYDAMIEQITGCYDEIETLASAEEQTPLAQQLHVLRGSCGMFGLVKVCKILGDFEVEAKANRVEATPGTFDELKIAVDAALLLLNKRLADQSINAS